MSAGWLPARGPRWQCAEGGWNNQMDHTHTHTNRVRVCVREERGVQDQKSEGKHHLKSITHHHNNQQEHPLMWDGWFSKMTDPNTRTPEHRAPILLRGGSSCFTHTRTYIPLHRTVQYSALQYVTERFRFQFQSPFFFLQFGDITSFFTV